METYRAYLDASKVAEALLMSHARECVTGHAAMIYREDAVKNLRSLAARLGFDLQPVENADAA